MGRIKSSKALGAFLALSLTAAAAAAPTADSLLASVIDQPDINYEGHTMVTQWFGKQARAEEIQVYHAKGDRWRREVLAPDGRVRWVILSDGDREEIQLIKQGKVLQGDAVRSSEKVMSPAKERELLLANYDLSAAEGKPVAGRPVWLLELKPKDPGKPSQQIWLDKETRVILKNKRLLPGRSFAAMSSFSRFEPNKTLDDDLFRLDASTAVAIPDQGLQPTFLSLEELDAKAGKKTNLPPELPGGFQFESADYFTVGKQPVRHVRYTDGLAIVSIFQTDRPVRLPPATARETGGGRSPLRLSATAKVLQVRRGHQNYTIMGDVSRELLLQIGNSLK